MCSIILRPVRSVPSVFFPIYDIPCNRYAEMNVEHSNSDEVHGVYFRSWHHVYFIWKWAKQAPGQAQQKVLYRRPTWFNAIHQNEQWTVVDCGEKLKAVGYIRSDCKRNQHVRMPMHICSEAWSESAPARTQHSKRVCYLFCIFIHIQFGGQQIWKWIIANAFQFIRARKFPTNDYERYLSEAGATSGIVAGRSHTFHFSLFTFQYFDGNHECN